MFGKRLRDLREERDLTQEEFAKILNVSQSTVVRYENGKYEPNYETLVKICKFFCVTSDYLLGLSDNY